MRYSTPSTGGLSCAGCRRPTHRRGFSLLEVMIALAILVTSLAILAETQSSAALMTREAERIITASDLAHLKYEEALLRLEEDGFQLGQQCESGDFDDLGDDAMNLEFGKELADYHWESCISEVDVELASSIMGDVADLKQEGGLAGAEAASADVPGAAGPASALAGLVGPEMITETIGPYIREVRVRVWWNADDVEKAEKDGSSITVTGHAVNPTGVIAAVPGTGTAPPPEAP